MSKMLKTNVISCDECILSSDSDVEIDIYVTPDSQIFPFSQNISQNGLDGNFPLLNVSEIPNFPNHKIEELSPSKIGFSYPLSLVATSVSLPSDRDDENNHQRNVFSRQGRESMSALESQDVKDCRPFTEKLHIKV